MRGVLSAAPFALLLALAAAPAGAGGPMVGGSWDLKLSCKGTIDGAPSRRKVTLFLPIQDGIGGDLQAGAGETGAMIGYVLYDVAKPERARIVLVGCNVSTLSGIVIEAAGKIVGDGGRLRGTAIFVDSPNNDAELCKAKLVRTSAFGAPVLNCS